MNLFFCALRPTGELIHKADLFGFLARLPRDVATETVAQGPFLAVAATGPRTVRSLVARHRHLVAVGDVRLDNRSELRRLVNGIEDTASDLQLVLAALDARGEAIVPALIGDFSFVAWDGRAHKVVAARDAFGVKSLFMRRENGMLLFASRAAPLAQRDDYDSAYMRDFLFGMSAKGSSTIWREVSRVEPGSVFVQRGTGHQSRRYWSSDNFQPAQSANEKEAVSTFRQLLTEGLSRSLDSQGATWAQLSGGLDSSSLVCLAEGKLGSGSIGGTVTLVDTLGNGDERAFSQLVVDQHKLRNVEIHDTWPWQDEGYGPPVTDEPQPLYPFYTRDQRMRHTVVSNGAKILLSGLGSDHYLFGNLNYIPDLLMAGRLLAAARELANWSMVERESFWAMARRHAFAPLVGRALVRARANADAPRLPLWLGNTAAIRKDFDRLFDFMVHPPRGRMFAYYAAREMDGVTAWVQRDGFEDGMEVRYPFLYRPLVEYSMRLPVSMRARPFARKWILREAMHGLLPEAIRTRQCKGGIDARVMWTLQREHASLAKLLEEPVLGDLGLIDVQALRNALEEARCGLRHNLKMLMAALSLETWLSVRSGRMASQRKAA
jgi:asparagine synthase (glutamine-hydrolysing)